MPQAALKAQDLTQSFLSVPGQDLVAKLLGQLARVKGFTLLFGPYKATAAGERETDQQRWADYQRLDWSIRQLPAINIFESTTENQDSTNAFVNGTVTIGVYWPPNFRRSDLARIPQVFKSVLTNFFASEYANAMLDEHWSVQRPEKVPGLNELGKTISWSPNLEGVVATESVPVTIVDVGYRIDLRAWYRELERQGRTQANPFEVSMSELELLATGISGVDPQKPDQDAVVVDSSVIVNNPIAGG